MDKGCSTVCVLIVALCALVHFGTVFSTVKTAKPGVCPRRRLHNRRCTKSCSKDRDCPNNEKCCSNGCGHECMAPLSAKPGVCPRRRLDFGHCAEICSNDRDCPNNEKCCSNGCGHECMAPVIAKPGVCPPRRLDFGHCAEICSNDRDCPNNEKCCSNGCGHECMAPFTQKRKFIHNTLEKSQGNRFNDKNDKK
uniref:WAP domain-containing protein n=1 Tax=Maylandia zebra TaxID=106582 RepID=A0A3P9CWV7_9CICH